MTYGWAILIVIIVAAALIALGVFNPATWTGSTATGFTDLGAPSQGQWSLDSSGNFNIVLKNNLASQIKIWSISATLNDDTTVTNSTRVTMSTSSSLTAEPLVNFGSQASGSAYSVDLTITYTPAGGFNQTETGTVTGKVA